MGPAPENPANIPRDGQKSLCRNNFRAFPLWPPSTESPSAQGISRRTATKQQECSALHRDLGNAPDCQHRGDRLGRSVAEVTRTIAELGDRQSRCAPYGKEWTPVPRPGVRWRRLWLLSLSLNSNSVVSAAPHPWIPPRPTPAGDQTAQAHPRTARSVAPRRRDRRTSPRTCRGVRGRTGDRVPLPITVWRQL